MTNEQRLRLRELAKNSTEVVQWYPHGPGDGYHLGKGCVRGPFSRWFMVEEVAPEYKQCVADVYDDAKFCAAAMNNLVPLLDELDKKDQIIVGLKAMLKGVL